MHSKKLFWVSFVLIIISEALSFAGFYNQWITTIAASVVVIAALALSLKNTAFGFILLILELLIGSQGYLLYFNVFGERLSLRIALWIVVMGVWIARRKFESLKNQWPLLALCIVIALASLNGYLKGNDLSLIFDEGKRWFYILALFPLATVFKNKEERSYLFTAVTAGIGWICLKTLILLYIFSHGLEIGDQVYAWTRYNLLGEITRLPNGFFRVFLQSQVFSILAFFYALILFLKNKKFWYGIFASINLAVIIISLSRSFWLGTAVAGLCLAVVAVIILRPKLKKVGATLIYSGGIILVSLVLLIAAVLFPIPQPLFGLDPSLLKDRATEFEAGAASRWALLPIMWQSISERPIEGQGLGKKLTYITSDPRVRQSSPTGEYTTNAFEWGWFDIWLKLGIFGIIIYMWFLFDLGKILFLRLKEGNLMSYAALASLIALVTLHFFTPYLNHPLGFGFIALLFILSFERSKSLA